MDEDMSSNSDASMSPAKKLLASDTLISHLGVSVKCPVYYTASHQQTSTSRCTYIEVISNQSGQIKAGSTPPFFPPPLVYIRACVCVIPEFHDADLAFLSRV